MNVGPNSWKESVRRIRVSVEKVYFKEENRGGELGIK